MSAWQDIRDWLADRVAHAKATYRLGYEEGERIAEEHKKKRQKRNENE